jgi:K+-transporting ATPase ATPase C chain
MAKQLLAGLRILVVMTVLLGILYPLGVWLVSRIPGLESNAEGSIVQANGQAVGSDLIGVDPVAKDPNHDPWFHTRPSAGSSEPLGPGTPSTSGGSNKGTSNQDLLALHQQRRDLIAKRERVDQSRIPQDAVMASGSGLDPQISPAYAELQVPRVARENGLPEDLVRRLVAAATTQGIADPGVNVLKLNIAVQTAERG